jgi:hypothetical protein
MLRRAVLDFRSRSIFSNALNFCRSQSRPLQPDRCPLGRALFLSCTPRPPPFSSMTSRPRAERRRRTDCGSGRRPRGRRARPHVPTANSEDQGGHRILIFNRTPISPVSSSVKWIPACSRAFCILRMVEKFPFTIPSLCSIRRKVARPMPALRESLSWLQPRSARAARI